ncbi:MAG: hypothetical protein ACJAQ2_002051 [Vicingaceae bacterium]|jgi:hypothetical protein
MKVNKKYIFTVILILAFAVKINAQELAQKPIPIELVLGNSRLGLQSIINKNLPESKRFSFFSVTNFESDYSQNSNSLDFINNSQISFEIYKGFGVSSGTNINKVTGLSPTLGLQYVFATPKWLFVVTPNLIFTTGNTASFLSILEYKPKLTDQLKVYSRVQGLYNHNIKSSAHERSYLQLRIGIEYKKYQFGLASNLDYFGPNRSFKENYGVFIRANL